MKLFPRQRSNRFRRGLSLIEILVALAVALAITAILLPTVYTAAGFQDEASVRKLTSTLAYLHQQAVLNNQSFRVGFHLEDGTYTVEMGDPNVLIFDDAEKRQEYEQQLQRRKTAKALKEQEATQPSEFDRVEVDEFVELEGKLSSGLKFRGVYTPQYGELVRADGKKDSPKIVYLHYFSSGFAEHAIIQLAEVNNEREGYTLEVESLTGRVRVHPELLEPDELGGDLPTTAPELP